MLTKDRIDPGMIHRQNKVSQRLALPMTPAEYCLKWVAPHFPIDPDTNKRKRGYREECKRQLSKATKLSESTINDWGSDLSGHPDDPRLYHELAMADALRDVIEKGARIFE
ncbi:MAG: hypothetical protein F6J87_14870 [Spirulina sp. SIO3F2]|nr:hypothetical protein [Spirulina sp. SIO3F2]